MKEERKEVKTYEVKAYCDKDGGEMKATGEVYDTYPPIYVHKCEWCDTRETSPYVYPRTVYKHTEVEE